MKGGEKMKNEIILFDNQDIKLEVNVKDDTVWLSTDQMAKLFGRDYKTIRKHINNALKDTFKINQLLNARGLSHDFGDGKGPVRNAYGPWFLRLDVPGFNDIGIHGTHLPESIGSRATEGCIRLTNDDITDLKGRVKVGTVVTILPDETNEQ